MPRVSLALLVALAAGCGGSSHPVEDPASVASTPAGPSITVMTYNVNYGLAGDATTLEAIAEGDADLVLLQETTPAWEVALRRRYEADYAHIDFRHGGGAGGLGVLSRLPFEAKELLPSEHGWFPAWRLVFDTPIGALQVLNVHLRPPISDGGSVVWGVLSTPPIREAEIRQLYPALDPRLPTLVAGDFNEGRHGRAIVYLEGRGLRSALPQFQGSQATWRWASSLGPVSAQLDHLVHDWRLQPRQVRVLAAGRSDHLPVVGVFTRAELR